MCVHQNDLVLNLGWAWTSERSGTDWKRLGYFGSRERIRNLTTQGCFIVIFMWWIGWHLFPHWLWFMSSSEPNAGTVSECRPSLFAIHSPEGGSASDVTSEHTRSLIETSISTADNRKGNDEKKSVSSVKAVREKGTSKNRAISTPRPLQNSNFLRLN